MQRATSILWVTLLLLAMAAGPVLAGDGVRATPIVDALNVRQGPGVGYAVLDVLHAGDEVALTGIDGAAGWFQVLLPYVKRNIKAIHDGGGLLVVFAFRGHLFFPLSSSMN